MIQGEVCVILSTQRALGGPVSGCRVWQSAAGQALSHCRLQASTELALRGFGPGRAILQRTAVEGRFILSKPVGRGSEPKEGPEWLQGEDWLYECRRGIVGVLPYEDAGHGAGWTSGYT